MVEQDVVDYMKVYLGSIVGAINLTDEALIQAARLAQSVYGKPYAEILPDDIKWRILANFFALDAALNFAVSFYKFAADGATVQGSDLFNNLNARWHNALAMAQGYLLEAGFVILAPGSPITPRNYGWRTGRYDTNYLADEQAVL